MSDLISRQAVIDEIRRFSGYLDEDMINRIYIGLNRLPFVQQEIVRCKDCKHYYYTDNRIPQEQRFSCDLDGDRWKPNDFCSRAERRTDEFD